MNGNLQDANPIEHGAASRAGAISNSPDFSDDLESTAEKIIESVPNELRHDAIRLVTLAKGFSGPTPPPAVLEAYEQLVPGSAKRFIDDYFQQKAAEADHRRSLQAKQLEYNREIQRLNFETDIRWMQTMSESRKRGQLFALTVALVVAAAGIIALFKGQAAAATVIIGSGIASSIAAMLLGHFKDKRKGQEALEQQE